MGLISLPSTPLRQTEPADLPTALVLHMHAWKRDLLYRFFPGRRFVFAPFHLPTRALKADYDAYLKPGADVFVWSVSLPDGTLDHLRQRGVCLHILEDAFLRSNRPHTSRAFPLSLAVDGRTAHFDASRPSDLEHLLATYDFAGTPDLLAEAEAGIARQVAAGISKYNGGQRVAAGTLYGPKTRPRVLVLGQVDSDASIRFGCPSGATQTDLIELAVAENPGDEVIFRPHPDVVSGQRETKVDLRKMAHICRISTERASLADAFDGVDRVYTLTSLGGFEALMRGLPVTVLGYPFYAGWGLTDDRSGLTRRRRRLTLAELFAGAYILYPRYFDPETAQPSSYARTIALLQNPAESSTEGGMTPTAVAPASLGARLTIALIEQIVSRIGTKDDGSYFRQYPYDFFQERPTAALRLLGRLIFSRPDP